MKKDSNTCIRVKRDGKQIDRCKAKIEEIRVPISSLARMMSLVSNEVRMKILFLLRQEGRLCVCDLSEILEMKIPAVSQHLRKLKDAELVYFEKEGATIYYHIPSDIKSKLEIIFGLLPEAELV
ncbi:MULTISPECIES: ArsR/SmtB family transcription factor [Phaeodactylibacter]|mgnify:CR=1 FL=1|jgi:DNA-binding transcriptional ArsR family regulator|uniref:Winged helix-turn-helix transcriptional regulator n=1 Tax=Phaeodactylibacter luteus TaxID=1564516 RepID=A0A5C6RJ41_9BACT|nr:metalloregulator ArsR/SmtB family transcription factor [Phaeodactylibacter luteus]TXB62321.1 winged helix-turn-helix transcriptional regulator [Phaeodactylibacter luteus]